MPDYATGKIYKITSEKGAYVGYTTQPLSTTLSGQLSLYRRAMKGKANYCSAFEVIHEAEEKIEIALIEAYPCDSKKELMARETEIIKEADCVNNKTVKTPLHEMINELNKEYRKHMSEYARDNYAKYVAPYRQREKEIREMDREHNRRLLRLQLKEAREKGKC